MNAIRVIAELLDELRSPVTEEQRRAWAVDCAGALGLDGLAVSMDGELLWSSDSTSARLEDVQLVPGQGPGLLLPDDSGMREVPDLGRLLMRFWPQFVPEAKGLGASALFVWPVHVGATHVGTLTGYRRAAGPLNAK